MTLINTGIDQQALQMAGGGVGFLGTATSATTTSLTQTGAGWTVNQWIGRYVVAANGSYGIVISNTATVLTVVRWYNPTTPGGSAGTTPSAAAFSILPGGAPAFFMGISTNSSGTVTATDTTMASEITTAGGGLIRYPAVYAHTTGGTGSYTLTGTFTANATDAGVGSQTVYRIGVFTDLTGGIMQYETIISAPATFVAIGDQAVITQTVTI